MKVAIVSDHAGFQYKTVIVEHLTEGGHQVIDFGTSSPAPVDYPDFVRLAAEAVANHQCDRGIVLAGSGNGEAMAANRYRGVRCAVCWDEESARLARAHNDANMLSLGERMVSESVAIGIVDVWMTTAFEGGRHIPRLLKLDGLP